MEWRYWITTGTLVTFVGGAIAHAYVHPLDPKKEHDEPQGICRVFRSTDNLSGTGSGNHAITPKTGSLVMVGEEVKVELRSA